MFKVGCLKREIETVDGTYLMHDWVVWEDSCLEYWWYEVMKHMVSWTNNNNWKIAVGGIKIQLINQLCIVQLYLDFRKAVKLSIHYDNL